MSRKIIAVIHNEPVSAGTPFSEASLDVLIQVEAVERAIESLGYGVVRIPFTHDIETFMRRAKASRMELAVNLCESLDEDPAFIGHPAAVLELMGIPFTGSSSSALMVSTDKHIATCLLHAHGLRAPRHILYNGMDDFDSCGLSYPVILKPRLQDASIGIDQGSVFRDKKTLREGIREFYDRFGDLVVEEYIAGREFNVSLFGYPSPRVLPLAEIDFSSLPQEMLPIVGYRAKWDISSFEYDHTPRMFSPALKPAVRRRVENTARECFSLFNIRDYCRVDMRIDERDRIYVFDVNANPCLSPDAGFAAAAHQAGMSYTDIIDELIRHTMQRAGDNGNPTSHI